MRLFQRISSQGTRSGITETLKEVIKDLVHGAKKVGVFTKKAIEIFLKFYSLFGLDTGKEQQFKEFESFI